MTDESELSFDGSAAAMDPSVAGGNHAATYVDRQVVEWLKQMLKYPAEGMGLQAARARSTPSPRYDRCDQHHGRAGYAESIARDNHLADRFAVLVDEHPDLELTAHNLSIVCLRARPGGIPEAELDSFNQAVLRRLQLDGEAFLTGTELDGCVVLRAGFVNPRTTSADIHRISNAIVEQAHRHRDEG